MNRSPTLIRYSRLVFVRYRSVPKKKKLKNDSFDSGLSAGLDRVAQDSKKAKQDIMKIIKKSQPSQYFDPENTTLDFSLPNEELCRQVTRNAQERMSKRYATTSKNWETTFNRICNDINDKEFTTSHCASKALRVKQQIALDFKNATITAQKANRPISVGDFVVLHQGSSKLFMIVGCPDSLKSSSYTFIDNQGKIIYGSKSLIKLRIPKVTSDGFDRVLENLVVLEQKHLNLAPVGVIDDTFSRSNSSLPPQLRKNSDATRAQRAESIPLAEDDFIVSQATGQLLTNTDVNTYMVPSKAREIYSKHLSMLALESFEKFKNIVAKLETLHRVLQFDENGDILDSPKSISIFQLMYLLESLELVPVKDLSFDQIIEYSKEVAQLLGESEDVTQSSHLGRLIPQPESSLGYTESKEYSVSTFLAVLLALRKQGRLWKLNQQSLSYPPKSITLLPLKHSQVINHLMHYCANQNGMHILVQYMKSRIQKVEKTARPPPYYKDLVVLFKDYVSGNIVHDLELESFIIDILRQVNSTIELNSGIELSTKYGKSACYLLIQKLGEFVHEAFDNPALWSADIALPTGSLRSQLDQQYYDSLDRAFGGDTNTSTKALLAEKDLNQIDTFDPSIKAAVVNDFEDLYETDPMEAFREDFGETPVYCIDSESAHEIDDGIAVRQDGNVFIVTVHVANPTSFIKPYSTLSQIAFNRGFTNYFPEGPNTMLPQFVGMLAGLGTADRTRTFAIEFEVDRTLLEACGDDRTIDKKSLTALIKFIKNSVRIRFYNVSNFPKGLTYNKVNEILQSKPKNAHYKNLSTLFSISKVLKIVRDEVGGGVGLHIPHSSIEVEYVEAQKQKASLAISSEGYELLTDGVKICVNNRGLAMRDSELLVSEMMIMANHLTSYIGDKIGVSLVHRNQSMNLNEQTVQDLKAIDFAHASVDEINRILEILSGAKLDREPHGHKALGLQYYSQITSPLRRYSDMVNQWNFQAHFLGQKPIENQLNLIISHLQDRESVNKKISAFSNQFWEGIFLRECLKANNENNIRISGTITKHLSSNRFRIKCDHFNNIRGFLEIDADTTSKNQGVLFGSGATISDLNIKKIDFIDNELILSINPASATI